MICKILNKRTGRTLTLTHQVDKWQLLLPKGLAPTNAQINVSALVGGHGSNYRSSICEDRQLVLTLAVYGRTEQNILELYDYVGTNEEVRFYYKTPRVDVYIDGWISSVAAERDANPVYMQIAINCPQPFFKSIDTIVSDWASREDFLEFLVEDDNSVGYIELNDSELTRLTFNSQAQIINNGQVEVGMLVQFECLDEVDNLTIISRYDESEFFGVNYHFNAGDTFVINTRFGEEEVYVLRDGVKINLLNYMKENSTWMQLRTGTNEFRYTGEGSDATSVHITYANEYKGV